MDQIAIMPVVVLTMTDTHQDEAADLVEPGTSEFVPLKLPFI